MKKKKEYKADLICVILENQGKSIMGFRWFLFCKHKKKQF